MQYSRPDTKNPSFEQILENILEYNLSGEKKNKPISL